MGKIIQKTTFKHTEKTISECLKDFINSPRFVLSNLYVFSWETDLLFLTKSGYFYEFEIKISRQDFKNDSKKTQKHSILDGTNVKNFRKPNYFYYVVPEGLVTVDEVPEYAGLIYIVDGRRQYNIIKKAPKIHGEKYDVNQMDLLDKFYLNMKTAMKNANEFRNVLALTREKYKDVNETMNNEYERGFNDGVNKTIDFVPMFMCSDYEYIAETDSKRCNRLNSRCSGNCEVINNIIDKVYE